MNYYEAIPDFRKSFVSQALQLLEDAVQSRDPRVVGIAQEALKDLLRHITFSEIYTETPLAEQIRTALVRDRIHAALSQPAARPITTLFCHSNSDSGITFVSITDLNDHATIGEIVERIALEIGTMDLVEIFKPGGSAVISTDLLSRRFCDVFTLSSQNLLSFRIKPQNSLGR